MFFRLYQINQGDAEAGAGAKPLRNVVVNSIVVSTTAKHLIVEICVQNNDYQIILILIINLLLLLLLLQFSNLAINR